MKSGSNQTMNISQILTKLKSLVYSKSEADGKYVDKSSTQTISGNKTFNDRTVFKKGSYMHSFGGGQDVGYVKFATITIDAQYQDCTATLVIMNRSYYKPVCVHIKFNGVANNDPNINVFTTDATDNNANDYYIVKADTSTWDVYAYKTAWNTFTVLDFWQTQNNAIHVAFTWKDEFVSSLPEGNIKSTFSAYNYNDLSNKPTIPSKTSQLTNDSGFLTSHQSLSNYLAKYTGVSEMGRYIDMHYDNATAARDYDVRLYVDSQGSSNGGGSFKISSASVYTPNNLYLGSYRVYVG
jgi:hypothetical protein